MHTAVAYGVSFNSEDVASAGPRQRLRSDALAVALGLALHAAKKELNSPAASAFFNERVCIVDPNVAFLMVRMERCALGPMDLLRKASVICVPIANFDTDEPEGGYHWTMLFLQKKSTWSSPDRVRRAAGADDAQHEKVGGDKNKNGDGDAAAVAAPTFRSCCWYPPAHVDSAVQQGGMVSSNTRFAQRAARVIMQGLAPPTAGSDDANQQSSNFDYLQSLVTVMGNLSLVQGTPQQHNSYDCGIFAALAVHAVLQMIGKEAVVVGHNHNDEEEGGDAQQHDEANKCSPTSGIDLTSALFPLPPACRVGDGTATKNPEDLIWPFDQETATEFRKIVFEEMQSAFEE